MVSESRGPCSREGEVIRMPISYLPSDFSVKRDDERCIRCEACVNQCPFDVHSYDPEEDVVNADESECVGCHRCVTLCPTDALTIEENSLDFRENPHWSSDHIKNIYKQAETGGALLSGMGSDKDYPDYFNHIVLNASQVTNPSIDPLREPMELRTYIGGKPDKLDIEASEDGPKLNTEMPPQLELDIPVMLAAMSFGSISYNAHKSIIKAAEDSGTFYNTGEGGLHEDFREHKDNVIVQVASGRFGVHQDYLDAGRAIEIKIGQGAKPGIGGHLPGEKVTEEISETRMIPEGTDALSPAPHHDIYSIEDLRQLIYALKEATYYEKPVGVKIAAVHNSAPIASGIVRAGADFVVIDGIRGGTGAAPTMIRDNVGIPTPLALAVVDERLREEGIRNQASIIASGGIRSSADAIKAIALGADAVYIGTAALVAMGCRLCQQCHTGKCSWGIATQDPELVKRLNPEIGSRRLSNLLRAWALEFEEVLGGMGVNAIESLRGNRDQLRGVGLTDVDLNTLGIKPAGEAW